MAIAIIPIEAASLLLVGLAVYTFGMLLFGLLALCKVINVRDQCEQWYRDVSMNYNPGSSVSTKLMKFTKVPPKELLLVKDGFIVYRDVRPKVSLNIYLLKEAFEELEKHPRILANPSFYDFAIVFMLETVQRAAFMKIPNDRKVDWLLSRYVTDLISEDDEDCFGKKYNINLISGDDEDCFDERYNIND